MLASLFTMYVGFLAFQYTLPGGTIFGLICWAFATLCMFACFVPWTLTEDAFANGLFLVLKIILFTILAVLIAFHPVYPYWGP